MKRIAATAGFAALLLALAAIAWIAFPVGTARELPAPLYPLGVRPPPDEYGVDWLRLHTSFQPQAHRSFCGPASLATVLRAYDVQATQHSVLSNAQAALDVFFTGLTLSELHRLAIENGMDAEVYLADGLTESEFRKLLKSNLRRRDDYVIVNYDRRVLGQSGAGHISPVAAFDETSNSFLVLDEASYRYPFTWIPAALLYKAARSPDGPQSRGFLLIHGVSGPSSRRAAP